MTRFLDASATVVVSCVSLLSNPRIALCRASTTSQPQHTPDLTIATTLAMSAGDAVGCGGAAAAAAAAPAPVEDGPAPLVPEQLIQGGWFAERQVMWPGQAMCLQVKEVLEHTTSDFQVRAERSSSAPPGLRAVLCHIRSAAPSPDRLHPFRTYLCLTAPHTAEFWCWMA